MHNDKVGYKVVKVKHSRHGACFVSAVAGQRFGGQQKSGKEVVYIRYFRTFRPKSCGPLAVFDDLKSAKYFCTDSDIIFKCSYVPSSDNRLWVDYFDRSISKVVGLPPGTVFADSVVLLERVW